MQFGAKRVGELPVGTDVDNTLPLMEIPKSQFETNTARSQALGADETAARQQGSLLAGEALCQPRCEIRINGGCRHRWGS